MTQGAIDVVLFDLGGVLIDFGGVGPMRDLAGIDSDEELWHRWLTCPWVRTFERGHCSPEAFASGMIDEWRLQVSADSFLTSFESWLGGTLPGAAELVEEVGREVRTGCLSNTNIVHWEAHSAKWPILTTFDFRFLSFEMGMVKPDHELFAAVVARLPAPPERVLFLDDNEMNVKAAAECGLQATHVRGVEAAQEALVTAGVLAHGADAKSPRAGDPVTTTGRSARSTGPGPAAGR